MTINICNEFTNAPGARHRNESEYSGEQFREELLEPRYLEAIRNNEILTVELDGGYGYATSFLEEAFGGLARKYDINQVLKTIKIISEDEPALHEDIERYIKNARDKKCGRK